MHSLNDKKKFDRENNLAQKVEVSNRKVRFVFSFLFDFQGKPNKSQLWTAYFCKLPSLKIIVFFCRLKKQWETSKWRFNPSQSCSECAYTDISFNVFHPWISWSAPFSPLCDIVPISIKTNYERHIAFNIFFSLVHCIYLSCVMNLGYFF
jgi:hypothetical protein